MTQNVKNNDAKALLFGLRFFSSGRNLLLTELEDLLVSSRKTSYIVTPNPEQIIQSRHDQHFLETLQTADYILPDGIGVVWASWFLSSKGQPRVTCRIAGREVVTDLLTLVSRIGVECLIVGGREYDFGQVKKDNPDLWQHIHWISGYKQVNQPTPTEEKIIQQTVQQLQPAIIFVAFGAPYQEKWMFSHQSMLSKAKIVMAVGGTFDPLLGKIPMTPVWLVKLHLEWLFRLLIEPWRWRRQLRLIEFVGLVITEKVKSQKPNSKIQIPNSTYDPE